MGSAEKLLGWSQTFTLRQLVEGPAVAPIEASQGLCVPVHRVASMDDGWQGRRQCARMEYLVLWTIALAVT